MINVIDKMQSTSDGEMVHLHYTEIMRRLRWPYSDVPGDTDCSWYFFRSQEQTHASRTRLRGLLPILFKAVFSTERCRTRDEARLTKSYLVLINMRWYAYNYDTCKFENIVDILVSIVMSMVFIILGQPETLCSSYKHSSIYSLNKPSTYLYNLYIYILLLPLSYVVN